MARFSIYENADDLTKIGPACLLDVQTTYSATLIRELLSH